MRKLRQILCVIISAALMISLCAVNVSAASAPKISKTSELLLVGGSSSIKITGTKKTVKWSSSDPSVCSVDKKGRIFGNKEGTAKIYAKVGKKKLTCTVTVVKSYIKPPKEVTIELKKNETVTLKLYNVTAVKVKTSDSKTVHIQDSYIVTENAKVVLYGRKKGTAYITVTDKNNKNASAKFKVTVTDESQQASGVSYQKDNKKDTRSAAEQVLELVNNERAAAGLSALTLDSTLCEAAQTRASELSRKFSHTRPDGRDCFSIFDDNNISYSAAAENIAKGVSSSSDVMKMWMHSSGHKANILNKSYKKLGVGYDSSSRSWVQLFTD